MPILVLRRHFPLSVAEITKLPPGCVAVSGEGDVVARARADGALPDQLTLAVRMGRAVLDARFEVEDEKSFRKQHPRGDEAPHEAPTQQAGPPPPARPAIPSGAPPPPPAAVAPPPASALSGDPWALLDAGHIDAAEMEFAGRPLDPAGRDRVRDLLRSTDPNKAALGCRLARLTVWKSAVQNIRRLLVHADTNVRRDAVEAIGALAGPALSPAMRGLLDDPSPEVREAARIAFDHLEGL